MFYSHVAEPYARGAVAEEADVAGGAGQAGVFF